MKRLGRSVLVTGAIAALGLSAAPAQAAQVTPPVIQGTSLTAGNTWSKITNAIAVDYNRIIDPASSSVVVLDGAGNVITGLVDTAYRNFLNTTPPSPVCQRLETDPTVLMFLLPATAAGDQCPILPTRAPLTEEDGPYTATFTARALNQITGTPDVVSTYTFRVDKGVPLAPSLSVVGGTALPRDRFPGCVLGGNPATAGLCSAWLSNPIPKQAAVSAPGESVRLAGSAQDRLDGLGNPDLASGIAKTTLHFFSLTSGDTSGREIVEMRIDILNTCDASLCPVSFSFQAQPELPNGYWNIRASTTDLAGNASGQSDPVAVLVAN